jgi:hypothetical protein
MMQITPVEFLTRYRSGAITDFYPGFMFFGLFPDL